MKNPVSGIIKYFQEVISEMRKVTWPTWQQTLRLTVVVVVVSVVIGAFAGGLDFLFTSALNYLINRS